MELSILEYKKVTSSMVRSCGARLSNLVCLDSISTVTAFLLSVNSSHKAASCFR